MIDKADILGMTLDEVMKFTREEGLPDFAARQICDWIYKKRTGVFEEMSNLSKAARQLLQEKFSIGLNSPADVQVSQDGTKKYLFRVKEGKFIETVFIPESGRSTLCLSSQVGCKMGCVFCMTGQQGFSGNLSSGEILNQILSLPEREHLTNYVFMGMGEPLANTENVIRSLEIMTSSYGLGISPSRITVSTIGILPGLEKLQNLGRCHLAISLHTPFDTERAALMPIEKAFPVKRIVDFLRSNKLARQRRVSFEYIMLRGINDTPRHINGLTRLLNGLRCRINLIRYHPVPGVPLEPTDDETIKWFKNRLNEKGLLTTLRSSRGKDIFAACGMLSTAKQLNTEKTWKKETEGLKS